MMPKVITMNKHKEDMNEVGKYPVGIWPFLAEYGLTLLQKKLRIIFGDALIGPLTKVDYNAPFKINE